MANATRVHALKLAIASGLAAWPALDGIQIGTAYLGDSTAKTSIQLVGPDDIRQEWGPMGRKSKDETVTLEGFVWTVLPGAGEPIVRAARARVVELAGEVEAFLKVDPSLGGTVNWCAFKAAGLREGAHPDGRSAQLTFNVEAFTRLQPS